MVLIITPIWLDVNSSLRVWRNRRFDLYQLLDILHGLLVTIAVAYLPVRLLDLHFAEKQCCLSVSATAG